MSASLGIPWWRPGNVRAPAVGGSPDNVTEHDRAPATLPAAAPTEPSCHGAIRGEPRAVRLVVDPSPRGGRKDLRRVRLRERGHSACVALAG